ncbi:transglutaminase family protein [Phenylobacterium sp.]|uniref:transglutaminase family protein n=1 Tax=Phenylobacterium sp. TaxID=1871053 RepID=UPI002DEF7A5E|nr:transglutaminase family protein [Phenylobacterium sp.]
MRIRVHHATTYDYQFPAEGVVQALRVSPSAHDGQRVIHWRVDVDVDGVLRERRDAFGNCLHIFSADQPVTSLTLRVTGEAEVSDTAGVVRGALEPFAPAVFLRTTELTAADDAIRDWAAATEQGEPLARLHALMARLHDKMAFDVTATNVATPAVEAFTHKRGVCQDYAHIFVAAARTIGIPARYVSGHLARPETDAQDAAHAWAEAFVPDLGWVAFDAANGVGADDSYLRVAVGLDYLDAAPMRGARRGGGEERLSVSVQARDVGLQRQE